jgi:hypothetical protein
MQDDNAEKAAQPNAAWPFDSEPPTVGEVCLAWQMQLLALTVNSADDEQSPHADITASPTMQQEAGEAVVFSQESLQHFAKSVETREGCAALLVFLLQQSQSLNEEDAAQEAENLLCQAEALCTHIEQFWEQQQGGF